ncbi:MAG: hypothetical protein DLM67_00540 [Candidatus Nephthysia bennettiae]|uniref:Uncharacterized protein n=1 Tax=Candidatus Nephthysia bennettiae TaxID=3127016 RepID=A0A934N5H3_9BACT|nr:hypothetical protein [Candidatus Dormibacteraeota bacterium]MBJ7612755.1 hypothetical protein [Candidatus Dormibacteraeota bacterium]PZS00811.1 MAG: hypothetical protein DLM67_00540 [Candidatus Dormibacteraeota bacterium]
MATVVTDGQDALDKKVRDSRQRRDDAYRKLGKHIERCRTCTQADSLQGPTLPFCPVGDGLLVELSHARWDLQMAVVRSLRSAAPKVGPAQTQRRSRYYLGTSKRPFGTHPRHREYT